MDASQRRWAVPIEATVVDMPPSITLHFLDSGDGLPYEVRRRAVGEVDWGAVLVSLPSGSTEWSDEGVALGVGVEYQVRKDLGGGETAFGYVSSGIDIDRTADRGVVLVVVDATLRTPLSLEIDRLLEDLVGDGWRPLELESARGVGWDDPVGAAALRQQIIDLWGPLAPADRPTHLFLLGHLPVARSGLDGTPPDGHVENRGAHPTDAFYADVDGVWTDDGAAPEGMRPDHDNVPGDGKYDQDFLPSELEMAFGRVDFAEIDGIGAETEVDILRRYLDRNHAYRWVEPGYGVDHRVLFVNGFIESVEMGWRTLPGIGGAAHTEFVEVAEIDAAGGPVAWANLFGPYAIFAQNIGVPDLAAHCSEGTGALLWSSDQSYFGLWAQGHSHIRSLLGCPGINLAWIWEVSPSYVFTDLAMGATLGEAVRRTAEHSPTNQVFERPERSYDEAGVWNRQFITLHGDPTLRLFMVAPPSSPLAAPVAGGNQISWTASPAGGVVGYLVERGTSRSGPFERLTAEPTPDPFWFDSSPGPNPAVYRVRAVRLEVTGGGSFLNPSTGVFAEITGIFADGFETGDTSAWD
jgi:hypothetical protein